MPSLYIEKLANALIPSATPSELLPGGALKAVNRFASRHGGLWVGGKVTAGASELSFVPNAMNRALHVGLGEIHIPLRSIRSVRRESGWFTGIVIVEHEQGEFRFRCYGAKQVAATLLSHVGAP